MDHNKLLAVQYRITGPGIDPESQTIATFKMEQILSRVIGVLTIFGVIFFAFQIIFAGYAFISSNGDKNKMEAARSKLTYGILGLTIIAVALGLSSLLANLAGIQNPLDLQEFFRSIETPVQP